MRDDPPDPPPELTVELPEPEEDMRACDLCNTLWPAEALQNGSCPDCLEEDGHDPE
jgi:hypothetical protein